MVNITGNGGFIDGEGFHGRLHAIERSRLPHEIDDEVVRAFSRSAGGVLQLDSNLYEAKDLNHVIKSSCKCARDALDA